MTAEARSHLIVAIDGPAGAGKSTVAARVAERYGLLNLESGAMYRAFALKAIETDTSFDEPDSLERWRQEQRSVWCPSARETASTSMVSR